MTPEIVRVSVAAATLMLPSILSCSHLHTPLLSDVNMPVASVVVQLVPVTVKLTSLVRWVNEDTGAKSDVPR